jgi:hypothetical protein
MAQTPQLKSTMFGRMPVGGQKPKGGKPAPAGPRGVRVEHRIGIQAPAEVIWEIIHDINHWGDWNPLYTEASGTVRIGETVAMTAVLAGMAPRKLTGIVLEWVPNEQLHYQVKALGGLVASTRYIEIEQLAPESCIVSDGEIMGGLLGPTVARSLGAKVYRGFREMNEALKALAEQRWRERAAKAS